MMYLALRGILGVVGQGLKLRNKNDVGTEFSAKQIEALVQIGTSSKARNSPRYTRSLVHILLVSTNVSLNHLSIIKSSTIYLSERTQHAIMQLTIYSSQSI